MRDSGRRWDWWAYVEDLLDDGRVEVAELEGEDAAEVVGVVLEGLGDEVDVGEVHLAESQAQQELAPVQLQRVWADVEGDRRGVGREGGDVSGLGLREDGELVGDPAEGMARPTQRLRRPQVQLPVPTASFSGTILGEGEVKGVRRDEGGAEGVVDAG